MSIKINLKKPILNLTGKPTMEDENTPQLMGKVLAHLLAISKTKDFLKFTDWAQELWAGRPLYLVEADRDELLKFIESNEGLTAMMKTQLHREISKAKPVADDKKTEDSKKS